MTSHNFRLIAAVGNRRPLWDSTMGLAARRSMFKNLWCEVSRQMQLDVSTCKRRFTSLRNSYRKEVRKIQQNDIATSTWLYFDAMEFLRPVFDPLGLIPFAPQPFDGGAALADENEISRLDDIDIDGDDNDSVDFEVIGDIFKGQASGSGLGGTVVSREPSAGVLIPVNQPPKRLVLPLQSPPSKRSSRRKIPSSRRITSSSSDASVSRGNSGSHQVVRQAAAVVNAATRDENDSDHSFLVSLMPHLKSLSTINNLKFRVEVSNLLMNLNAEELQNQQAQERGPSGSVRLPAAQPNLTNSAYDYGNEIPSGSVASQLPTDYVDLSMSDCDIKIENEPIDSI